MKRIGIMMALLTVTLNFTLAQLEGIDPEFLNTLNVRAGNIVKTLNLTDSRKAERVQEIIVIQYYELSKIHDIRDSKLEEIRTLDPEAKEKTRQDIEHELFAAYYVLNAGYMAKLSAELTQDQIVRVKNGMTYGVLERTYKGYLTLLPDLTDEQKRFIYRNLVEAREFAVNAGSSEEKHAWFGKYKGRINNYLSEQGYDLKKAEEKQRSDSN